MTPHPFRQRLAGVALLACLSLVAAACSGERPTAAPSPSPKPASSEPNGGGAGVGSGAAKATGNPLGAKWDATRVTSFAPYIRSLAPGYTFTEVVWCQVEPKPGQWDWRSLDQEVSNDRSFGATVFFKLVVGGCWVDGNANRHKATSKLGSAMPTDLSAYRTFVTDVVSRYAPLGVHEYAIENEINAAHSWTGPMSDYATLARVAAAAIHASDPRALVATCGLGSTVYGIAIANALLSQGKASAALSAYRLYESRRFSAGSPEPGSVSALRADLAGADAQRALSALQTTFTLLQQHVFQIWQLHFYERWDSVPLLMGYLHSILPAGMPVQAWEVGNYWQGGSMDQAVRATEIVKTVSLLLAAGVRPVIWLPLAFNPVGRHPTEPRYGLLDPNGTARVAGTVFRTLSAAASDAQPRPVTGVPGLQGLALVRPTGDSSLVVWADGPAQVPLSGVPAGAAHTENGATVPSNGAVTVGQDPLVITAAPDQFTGTMRTLVG